MPDQICRLWVAATPKIRFCAQQMLLLSLAGKIHLARIFAGRIIFN
jgi:hypothetical protein